MTAVTLQFCGFDSAISNIISWGTQGSFEWNGKEIRIGHVDIVVPEGLLGAQHEALGGKPPGVWVRPADYGKTCGMLNPIRVKLDCTQGQYDTAIGFALAQVGKPYDTTGLVSNFILGRNWRDPNAWWCSELAAEAVGQAGIFRHPMIATCNRVSPALLFAVASTYGLMEAVAL